MNFSLTNGEFLNGASRKKRLAVSSAADGWFRGWVLLYFQSREPLPTALKTMRHHHADHLDRLYASAIKGCSRSEDAMLSEIVRVYAHHGTFIADLFDSRSLGQIDTLTEHELKEL